MCAKVESVVVGIVNQGAPGLRTASILSLLIQSVDLRYLKYRTDLTRKLNDVHNAGWNTEGSENTQKVATVFALNRLYQITLPQKCTAR